MRRSEGLENIERPCRYLVVYLVHTWLLYSEESVRFRGPPAPRLAPDPSPPHLARSPASAVAVVKRKVRVRKLKTPLQPFRLFILDHFTSRDV